MLIDLLGTERLPRLLNAGNLLFEVLDLSFLIVCQLFVHRLLVSHRLLGTGGKRVFLSRVVLLLLSVEVRLISGGLELGLMVTTSSGLLGKVGGGWTLLLEIIII